MKMSNSFALVLPLILLFCMSVRCGVFDDEATVRKARCYANCITMVSKIPINDSSCSSSQCLECTIPCDRNFESVDNCTQNCPNASTYCNPSCTFLRTTKNWTNIYQGNGKTIRKPGVAHNATRNVTTLTLSWQPSVNASGTVVYLLKEKMSGDKQSLTPSPLKGLVFLEPRAILKAKDACGVKLSDPPQYRHKYDGITFAFTVVALTEVSTLVEGQESSDISFQKAEPFLSLHNASLVYNPNNFGDKFDFRVLFTPSLSPSSVTEYVGLIKKTGGKCESSDVVRTAKKKSNVNRLSADFQEEMLTCNISFTAYSLTECLPSKPSKSIGYYYKGCHYHPGMNTLFCCKFDPLPTPDSAKMVRYFSYSLQTQSDFRFTANITWLPPTQPCPVAGSYKLGYPVYHPTFKLMLQTYKSTSNTYYIMPNIEPNLERNVTLTPNFRRGSKFWDLGVDKVIAIRTPELPKKELVVQDVNVSQDFSSSGRYSYNISWKKQPFPYGTFQGYAFKVTNENVSRSNVTNETFVVIDGIQHSESRIFKVKPMYKETWIEGVTFSKVIRSPDPIENQLKVGSPGQKGEAVEDIVNNTYSITVSWKPPSFQYKPVDYYRVSYSLSGYPEFACDQSNVRDNRCRPVSTKETSNTVTGILPREHFVFTVKPKFLNSRYVQGISTTIKIDAPFPRRELVAVRNLTNTENNPLNYTNVTSFSWKVPLFKHSAVKQYDIKYNVGNLDGSISNQNTVVRRSVKVNGTNTILETSTMATMFSLPKLQNGQKLTFQVTPIFKREIIVGEKKEIVISIPPLPNNNSKSTQLSQGEIAALIIFILLLLLLVIVLVVWFVKRRQKLLKNGLLAGPNGALIDHWEVPIDKISWEEELGEGAFGKVFKGMLVELPEQSAKYSIAKSIRRKSLHPMCPEDGYVVAIKTLHDFADLDQRKEFLKEIQLMKDVGSHRNIVNMLGCGTVCEPMFLIVEYLPNGDLLHYLRKRRGKAMQYPDSDPRGPYHSTYCQTYFNKNNPSGGISLQPSRSDRVYVHTPEPQKDSKNGEIQLVSVQKIDDAETQDGVDNGGIEQQPDDNREQEMTLQQEDEEDILTSGDLMAFAWQVSQGMEYLSKRGYVHRDLAARNVLVGNNKEAKIADFGLTRHMYEDLYQAKTNRKLPLKWMSIEAIFDQSFTSQSDVWAYGVFLWELVTLGGTPYPSINNRELLKLLKEGYRMEKPETCDTELYNIMCTCWKEKPEDRPTFVDLREKLEEMMTRDNPYFDPTAVDESRDYYNVPSFNSAPEPENDDDITEVIIGEASSPGEDSSPDNNNKTPSVEEDREDATLTFENLSFNDNEPDLELDQVVFDNDNKDNTKKSLKYAKLDFDDIEFQLYRRQNHGLVL